MYVELASLFIIREEHPVKRIIIKIVSTFLIGH